MFKVDKDKNGDIVLKEVYNSLVLQTSEGNEIAICMRDDTFEFCVIPKDGDRRWFRVDMQKLEVNTEDGECSYCKGEGCVACSAFHRQQEGDPR